MNVGSATNLPSLAISSAGKNVISDVGVAMLSKSLDTAKESGEATVKMMEQSVNPHIGGNIDYSI